MTARTREPELHGTTILSVRHGNRVVLGGDGQVTLGQTVLKHNARKVRRLHHDRVLAGFAGAGADALTLFERFEVKLQAVNGNLRRAAVELGDDLARREGRHRRQPGDASSSSSTSWSLV